VVDAPAIRAKTVFAINAANLADGDEDQTLRTSFGVSGKDKSAVTPLSCHGRILGEGETKQEKTSCGSIRTAIGRVSALKMSLLLARPASAGVFWHSCTPETLLGGCQRSPVTKIESHRG
jgi:hypothetical protein